MFFFFFLPPPPLSITSYSDLGAVSEPVQELARSHVLVTIGEKLDSNNGLLAKNGGGKELGL
jgi:hypothetical protein